MSVNRNRPHAFVLPEDDANLQLATGFVLECPTRQIQRLPVAGGWREVLTRFKSDHLAGMDKYPDRLMVLLIDFDRQDGRLGEAKAVIPEHLRERVFVLGAWDEPEDLTDDLGSYETIGRAMAEDCRNNTTITWGHDLLRHNADELARLCERIRPILSS
ncbi:MAG: hypothetical protein ABSH32_31560 [Bryobacteraceae bacterium]|jgi:hypothetical protein